jgi:inner membrane protein
MAPDIDVIWSRFGAHYGDLQGHRGFTHSIVFAGVLATVAFLALLPTLALSINRSLAWTYLFLATASHGVLDAMTDSSGLGIPFFWPFDSTRYFFPFTPIAMSPIGTHFFSERGFLVLLSEARWVWIPSLAFAATALSVRRVLTARSISKSRSDNL